MPSRASAASMAAANGVGRSDQTDQAVAAPRAIINGRIVVVAVMGGWPFSFDWCNHADGDLRHPPSSSLQAQTRCPCDLVYGHVVTALASNRKVGGHDGARQAVGLSGL